MSVIIKAKNVVFNNPNLPIITPMISEGLQAAFRPNNTTLGLSDFSGHGATLTPQGNPQLTDTSIIVDRANGFVSNVRETTDLTMIVVHRAIKTPTATAENQWLGMVAGTYYNDRGISVFNNINTGKNEVDTLGATYAKKTSDVSMQLKNVWLGSQTANIIQNYQFTAFVLKASDNKVLTYAPFKQSTSLYTYDGSADGSRLDLRYLSDPANGIPNYFKLGIANVPFGDGKSEIAEVLLYNRALTQEEVMRQYQYSKDFMQKHRGITI